jgi:hypothetical protein
VEGCGRSAGPALHLARYGDPADLRRVIEEDAHGNIATIIVRRFKERPASFAAWFLVAGEDDRYQYACDRRRDDHGFGRTGWMFGCDVERRADIVTVGRDGGRFPISGLISDAIGGGAISRPARPRRASAEIRSGPRRSCTIVGIA